MMKRKARIAWIWLTLLSMAVLAACASNTTNESKATPIPTETAAAAATASPAGQASPSAAPEKKEHGANGFLWKVTGGKHDGYLVGTIHFARPEMYPLHPNLERALQEADFVALELDLTKVDQIKTLALVNERAMLPEGTTLLDRVDGRDYKKFQEILKKSLLAAGAPMLDRYEPWYAAMTLESLPAMKYMSTDGIDQYIAKQAHQDGKTVLELESMEAQLDIFDEFSDELQKLYFRQTVNNAAAAQEGLEQLLDMWTAGELEQLEAVHEQFDAEGDKTMGDLYAEYSEAILGKRNAEMAEKVDHYLRDGEEGTYMIAVGSLHMVGEEGLVSLLEKKGYQVEFVK
jgi:uncharacterized protein YbaP (TraB family)